MKNLLLLAVLFLSTSSFQAQEFASLNNIELTNANDYKQSEDKVLECSNFLLNNPIDEEKQKRQNCLEFILRWMEGTPEFRFSVGSKVMKVTKGKPEYLQVYLAAVSKTALEHEDEQLKDNEMQKIALQEVASYCQEEQNNLEPSREMRKMM